MSLLTLLSHRPSDSAGELSSVCGIHLKPQYILLQLIVCEVGGPQGGGAAGHIDPRTPLSFPPAPTGTDTQMGQTVILSAPGAEEP